MCMVSQCVVVELVWLASQCVIAELVCGWWIGVSHQNW